MIKAIDLKKVILIVAAIAISAGSVNAGPQTLIGLYVDSGHTVCRQDIPVPYQQFTVWVYVLPGDDGMICAEYRLSAPSWLIIAGTTVNPAHSIALGDNFTGVTICFAGCQSDWTWTYQFNMFPMSSGIPDYMNVLPYPNYGLNAYNCLPGYPIEEMIVLNNLGLNRDCDITVGTETVSWGAIKNMYGN